MSNAKKRKSDDDDRSGDRKKSCLGAIQDLRNDFLCKACQELPDPYTFHQCTQGHLICDNCLVRILVRARITKRVATCPACCSIMGTNGMMFSSKNDVLSKVLRKMHTKCTKCELEVEYDYMPQHLQACNKREVSCANLYLGCVWRGPYDESAAHQAHCEFLNKSAEEILLALEAAENSSKRNNPELLTCHLALSTNQIFRENILLNFVNNTTDDLCTKLYSNSFTAFNESWRLSVSIDLNESRDISQLNYCLKIVSWPPMTMDVSFSAMIPKNQYSKIDLEQHTQSYTRNGASSGYRLLPIVSTDDAYRFLAKFPIFIRICMSLNY